MSFASVGHQYAGEINGLELLKTVKRKKYPQIRVSMITAYGDSTIRNGDVDGGGTLLYNRSISFRQERHANFSDTFCRCHSCTRQRMRNVTQDTPWSMDESDLDSAHPAEVSGSRYGTRIRFHVRPERGGTLSKIADQPDIGLVPPTSICRDGRVELLHRINELKNPALKAVIVSAYGDMDNIRTAMNAAR